MLAGEHRSATPTNDMTEAKLNSEARAEQVASKTPKANQTIKLGLDVHADTIVVVRILDHNTPQPAQKFMALVMAGPATVPAPARESRSGQAV